MPAVTIKAAATTTYSQSLLMPKSDRRLANIFEILPENRIKAAAEIMDEGDNSFASLLKHGQEFKSADLTPIYILNSHTSEVYVTSVERMNQDFH